MTREIPQHMRGCLDKIKEACRDFVCYEKASWSDADLLCWMLISNIVAIQSMKHGYTGPPQATLSIATELMKTADTAIAELARQQTESN